jgi:hypothetical protein
MRGSRRAGTRRAQGKSGAALTCSFAALLGAAIVTATLTAGCSDTGDSSTVITGLPCAVPDASVVDSASSPIPTSDARVALPTADASGNAGFDATLDGGSTGSNSDSSIASPEGEGGATPDGSNGTEGGGSGGDASNGNGGDASSGGNKEAGVFIIDAGPPTGCGPGIPVNDAGSAIPPDASADFLAANVAAYLADEYDAGQLVLSAPGSLCAIERAVIDQYSPTSPITPTEQLFLNQDVAFGNTGLDAGPDLDITTVFPCTSCLELNDCLDNEVDHKSDTECGDLVDGTGAPTTNAAGVPRNYLCTNVISCTLETACLLTSGGVPVPQTCFCGSTPQSQCGMVAQGTGVCAQVEADGVEEPITDAPDVLKFYSTKTLGGGMANFIFECAGINNCSACW